MLSIGKLAAGQARYYLDQAEGRVDVVESVGDGVEDYYVGAKEARGAWIGGGAARLGLSGDVGGPQLRQVLSGLDPASGAPLRVGRVPVRVAGFNLTFSAPKSVSIVFGIADPSGHIAQGLTVDRGFVLAEAGLTREWGYTALTRGREANHLYFSAEGDAQRHEYAPVAPRETRTAALTALARALSADSAHHLALDAAEAQGDVSRRDVAERMAAQDELHRARRRRIELEHGVRRWMPGQRRALETARTEEARAAARLRQPHHRDATAEIAAQTEARARRPLSEKADDLERLRQRQLGRERKPPEHGIELGL